MRLVIEIAAAALFVVCITVTSAAFAAGKSDRTADGLSCAFSVPQNASPAARCAAVRRKVLCELLRGQAAVGDVRRANPLPSSWRKPGPITPTFKSSPSGRSNRDCLSRSA